MLLLAVLGLSPITATVFALDASSSLPACCRRNGQHHCVMSSGQSDTTGSLHVRGSRCALFPTVKALPAQPVAGSLRLASATFAGVVSHPASRPQTEALLRISCSRAGQKRGPPTFLF